MTFLSVFSASYNKINVRIGLLTHYSLRKPKELKFHKNYVKPPFCVTALISTNYFHHDMGWSFRNSDKSEVLKLYSQNFLSFEFAMVILIFLFFNHSTFNKTQRNHLNEHLKQMFKLTDKKIFTFYANFSFI